MHSEDAAASGRQLVESYYDAIDTGDYDRLASLLSPAFVHDRPDQTLSGRETFVSFMRDDRPETDTRHDVTATYRQTEGDGWVVRGRLLGADGDVRFTFVDVFTVGAGQSDSDASSDEARAGNGRVRRIETFAREN
ncbi:nuclear transport factor 2 family protein [Halogeometricum borinquense]|uniref:Nuclear transport factor 2 family protein n=1 Tax=Halogeometricum borinquense TaxID=60847 RepID=A0A6C0UL34_9EURY|nr:nuclear transport factor 2 family protein [Halogeometricum borinquense]QIB75900.1 nuclear transport factor 2 family protein [Halogeometricum borinquense]QIQ75517.1 nuclear transport factor 2 family protein [Halogeometricum borinquense]